MPVVAHTPAAAVATASAVVAAAVAAEVQHSQLVRHDAFISRHTMETRAQPPRPRVGTALTLKAFIPPVLVSDCLFSRLPPSAVRQKSHQMSTRTHVVTPIQVSEVLCTTVAEALAMGKWVVCSRHSSNEFFFQFPNCLPFDGEEDFAACVSWALRHDPEDLTPALRYVCRRKKKVIVRRAPPHHVAWHGMHLCVCELCGT